MKSTATLPRQTSTQLALKSLTKCSRSSFSDNLLHFWPVHTLKVACLSKDWFEFFGLWLGSIGFFLVFVMCGLFMMFKLWSGLGLGLCECRMFCAITCVKDMPATFLLKLGWVLEMGTSCPGPIHTFSFPLASCPTHKPLSPGQVILCCWLSRRLSRRLPCPTLLQQPTHSDEEIGHGFYLQGVCCWRRRGSLLGDVGRGFMAPVVPCTWVGLKCNECFMLHAHH